MCINCLPLRRITFFGSILDSLLIIHKYEKAHELLTNVLSTLKAEILLLNDMRHLKTVHCNDHRKLRLNACAMDVKECPFINDKNQSRFNSVINQIHICLAHTNKAIYREIRNGSHLAFNRFVMDTNFISDLPVNI